MNNTHTTNTAEATSISTSQLTETVVATLHENRLEATETQDYLKETNALINDDDKALYKQKSLKVEKIVFSY